MQLEIKIDGESYVVAHEHDATEEDLKEFAKKCASGHFATIEVELATVQRASLVLGHDAMKRAVYVISN